MDFPCATLSHPFQRLRQFPLVFVNIMIFFTLLFCLAFSPTAILGIPPQHSIIAQCFFCPDAPCYCFITASTLLSIQRPLCLGYPPFLCNMSHQKRYFMLPSGPCQFCVSLEKRDWVSQVLRIEKIRRDWESGMKQIQNTPAPNLSTPKGTASPSVSFLSGTSAAHPIGASQSTTFRACGGTSSFHHNTVSR